MTAIMSDEEGTAYYECVECGNPCDQKKSGKGKLKIAAAFGREPTTYQKLKNERDRIMYSTHVFAELFAEHYFGKDSERWWVADDIGGVFYVNDYFFSVNDMTEYVKHRYSLHDIFTHYAYRLDVIENNLDLNVNIKNWKKIK